MSEWINKVRQLYERVTHTRIYSRDNNDADSEVDNWPPLGEWRGDDDGRYGVIVHRQGNEGDKKQWATQFHAPRCMECGSLSVEYDEYSQPVCQVCDCLAGGHRVILDEASAGRTQ